VGCSNAPQQSTPPAAATSQAPPQGAAALANARKAFQQVAQFTLTQTTTTDIGVFTMTTKVDCAGPYYYYKRTTALTPKGVEQNTTQLQGRARDKTEEERVFVDGQSFDRYSGSWENPSPGTDDARPNWEVAKSSYDPTSDCQAFAKGTMTALPFGKMLAPSKIAYSKQRSVGGYDCHEFTITYPDQVLDDKMRETDDGKGNKTAYRGESTKNVEGTLCLAVDDSLPLEGRYDNGMRVFELGYAPIDKISVRLSPIR